MKPIVDEEGSLDSRRCTEVVVLSMWRVRRSSKACVQLLVLVVDEPHDS